MASVIPMIGYVPIHRLDLLLSGEDKTIAQFNSYRTLGNKYKRLGSPGSPIYEAFLEAHSIIAARWDLESRGIMERRIYSKYIPTYKEYDNRNITRTAANRINKQWRDAGGFNPHPGSGVGSREKGKAWKRTHLLYQSQKTTFDINSVQMLNSARNKSGYQYAAARHNLGAERSPVKNSVWTEVAEFQRESRQMLRNRGFFVGTYRKFLEKALSIGPDASINPSTTVAKKTRRR